MVHALEQTWRVLKADGILIDLRPRHTGQIIEVVRNTTSDVITCYDDAYREARDFASDEAIEMVVNAGLFQRVRRVYFEYVKQYESGTALMDYFMAKNPPVRFPDEIESRLYHQLNLETSARLHYTYTIQLDTYRKMA